MKTRINGYRTGILIQKTILETLFCDRCGKETFDLEETDSCGSIPRWLPQCSPKMLCRECRVSWDNEFAKWLRRDPKAREVEDHKYHKSWHEVFDPWFKMKEVVQFT